MAGTSKNPKRQKSPAEIAAQRARTRKNKQRKIQEQIDACELALLSKEDDDEKLIAHIERLKKNMREWK